MNHKIGVAYEILTIANNYDGQVYGGFVRDVIVPRKNNGICDVSFKDVDIWFKDKIASSLFIAELIKTFNIENEPKWNKNFDYNQQKNKGFSRSQYRIYSKNEFLFHIDVITSEKLPVNDFLVNTITYKRTEKGFIKTNIVISDSCFTDKIALMFQDYNPLETLYYDRIYRIFFSKGWTVRCIGKHEKLSTYIQMMNLNVKENKLGDLYDYVPISNAENMGSLKNTYNEISMISIIAAGLKDDDSNLNTTDKDILRLIFNKGLEVLNGRIYNSINDDELQSIYKLGLEDYRVKIDKLLK